jgi:nucleotide-binding universal stress UspA family protein
VVAFDGSDAAGAAVRAAATLMPERLLLVVAVWEPGLAFATTPIQDPSYMAYTGPQPEQVVAMDRAQRDRAAGLAEAGAEIARELGARAEPVAICDEVDVAETIAGIVEQHDACAVIVGSRGRGAVKSLFGSTSRALLARIDRPVLVVKAPGEAD